MEKIAHILQEHPELAIFLTLSLGFAFGHIKIGSFKIGVVLGALFAGVLIGQLNITIPPIVKTIFFDFFLFTTGYKVGLQFFQSLKKNAFPQLVLMLVICICCLLTAFGTFKFLNYDCDAIKCHGGNFNFNAEQKIISNNFNINIYNSNYGNNKKRA